MQYGDDGIQSFFLFFVQKNLDTTDTDRRRTKPGPIETGSFFVFAKCWLCVLSFAPTKDFSLLLLLLLLLHHPQRKCTQTLWKPRKIFTLGPLSVWVGSDCVAFQNHSSMVYIYKYIHIQALYIYLCVWCIFVSQMPCLDGSPGISFLSYHFSLSSAMVSHRSVFMYT